jgi:phosphonate degradation associated HDIG domain protein
MADLDSLFTLLERRGDEMYGGEAVTQLQHALQSATLALEDNAGDALITAALFHDIGHLLSNDDGIAASKGIDLAHEEIAAEHLAQLFGPEVVEPVRLHVPAKRYLCATDPDYLAQLSPASRKSLEVQGGPFNEAEAELFINGRHGPAAVRLRQWDDLAKDPEMTILTLASFKPHARRVLM